MNFSGILNSACCDKRVKKGIPDLKDPEFCFVLQEYLIKEGLSAEVVAEKTHMLFEKGKFPERQAYNKDGILVTFPNKEYRDRAVDKGTHFANNPKHADSNIFTDKDLSGTDSLSLADIRPEPEEKSDSEQGESKPSSDVVSVDNYVDNSVENDETDSRNKEEKSADADAIDTMLNDDPLSLDRTNGPATNEDQELTYPVDEVINNYDKYGMYRKGKTDWYDSNDNLIGEQIYDDNTNSYIIKIINKGV